MTSMKYILVAPFAIVFLLFVELAGAQSNETPQDLASDPDARHTFLLIDLQGCPSCRAWKRQVEPAYSASNLGILAPLERVEIREIDQSPYAHLERPSIFPTFVLLGPKGNELDRIVGYNSADFFWGYTDLLFRNHGIL